jgi:hypothetical protein
MCTHVSKCKNETCWNYTRNQGGGGMKENGWGGEFVWYIWYIVMSCVCHNITPTHHNNKRKKKKMQKIRESVGCKCVTLFWILYAASLVYMLVFMTTPCCFGCCGSEVWIEIICCVVSRFVLFAQISFGNLGSFVLLYEI